MSNVEKYYLILNDNCVNDYYVFETLEQAIDKVKEVEKFYCYWFIVKGIEVLNSDDSIRKSRID